MKIVRNVMALIAFALMSVTASAADQQYHLSYTFNSQPSPDVWLPADPWMLEADFTGTRDGDLIRNLHFTRLTISNLLIDRLNTSYLAGTFGEAILSFSGKSNDIRIFGTGPVVDLELYSYTVSPDVFRSIFFEAALYYDDDNHPPSGLWRTDNGVNASWTISAVPEPASYAMLMLGLGVVALRARKRTAA